MNQDNQIGFFRQYFVACFQPSKYKELLKKKARIQVGYVSLLIIFLVFVETVIPFAAWNVSVGGMSNLILNRIPEFTIEDGTMTMKSPVSFQIGQMIRVEADAGVEKFEDEDLKNTFQEEILISKTNILMKAGEKAINIPMTYFHNKVVNNQDLFELLPAIRITLFCYLVITIVLKAIQYLAMAAILALFCRAGVRNAQGKCVSFQEAFVIALYAKTLFGVIGSVNACLGYILGSFLELVLSVLVTVALIYRAEMSVLQVEIM